ncbi:uncharacterized protein LOC110849829 [Folsomia candida]|nr:uncharacterized protein LOC110849829 [Folsomia candida]
MLIHLQTPIIPTGKISPICLPPESGSVDQFNAIQLENVHKCKIELAGWKDRDGNFGQLNLRVLSTLECLEWWKREEISYHYKNRFCAVMEHDDKLGTPCVTQDLGPTKKINGTYYLIGLRNMYFPSNITGLCDTDAIYFFIKWKNRNLKWIRNNQRCGPYQFTCGNGNCIPLRKLCDWVSDCDDDTDEDQAYCAVHYKCPSKDLFYCGQSSSPTCIPNSKVNDGVMDCTFGNDETEDPKTSVYTKTIYFLSTSLVGILIISAIIVIYLRKRLPTKIKIESPWKTNPSLICLNELGNGSFGKVYRAKDIADVDDDNEYAVKCCDIRFAMGQFNKDYSSSDEAGSAQNSSHLTSEIRILRELTCDNVVRLYDCWAETEECSQQFLNRSGLDRLVNDNRELMSSTQSVSPNCPSGYIFIKMELCSFTLQDFLEEGKMSTDGFEFAAIATDIVAGLGYIHAKGYIHRDLKPSNILCKVDSRRGRNVWKIGDFGLTIQMVDEWTSVRTSGIVGTMIYACPEMGAGQSYTTKADMFSLGLIFMEIGQSNWSSDAKIRRVFLNSIRGELDAEKRLSLIENNLRSNCQNFAVIINQLLCHKPKARLSCIQVEANLKRLANAV